MSRWIDAEEFGRCLQNYRPYVDSGRFNAIQTEVNQVLDCIEYEIEDAPSIDIVRCSECVYSYEVDTDFGALRFCKKYHYHFNADDFCSHGERNSSEKPNNSKERSK